MGFDPNKPYKANRVDYANIIFCVNNHLCGCCVGPKLKESLCIYKLHIFESYLNVLLFRNLYFFQINIEDILIQNLPLNYLYRPLQ